MTRLGVCLLVVLSACASDRTSEYKLGNQDMRSDPVGIYLIPVFGADRQIITDLQKRLSKQHGLRVKITTEMGLDSDLFDETHKQYVVERIEKTSRFFLGKLRTNNPKVPAVIIIPGDMNSEEFQFRFIFSMHYVDHGLTVVSLARIDPRSYGFPANHDLMLNRATKLVNKGLGYHLYGYKASSSMKNVMYGPIMGLDDLDSVNMWYE